MSFTPHKILMISLVAGGTLLASCTSKITEEQLAELTRLRNQERTINQQISSKRSELSRLEGEVAARQAEVDNCESRKEFVEAKLPQWPNVWPDWDPAAQNPGN